MSVHELSDVIKSKTPSSAAATGATVAVASPPPGRPARLASAQRRTNTISLASWVSLFCFAMRAHRSMAPRSTDNIIDPDGRWPPRKTRCCSPVHASWRWCGVASAAMWRRQYTAVRALAIYSRYIFANLLNTLSL